MSAYHQESDSTLWNASYHLGLDEGSVERAGRGLSGWGLILIIVLREMTYCLLDTVGLADGRAVRHVNGPNQCYHDPVFPFLPVFSIT